MDRDEVSSEDGAYAADMTMSARCYAARHVINSLVSCSESRPPARCVALRLNYATAVTAESFKTAECSGRGISPASGATTEAGHGPP